MDLFLTLENDRRGQGVQISCLFMKYTILILNNENTQIVFIHVFN